MAEPAGQNGIVLTEAQKRARRRRNVALAVAIAGLCILFYAITVFKMGSSVLNRTM